MLHIYLPSILAIGVRHTLDHGNEEPGSLARASLCHEHQVPFVEEHWQGDPLGGRQLCIATLLDVASFEDRGKG